MVRIHVGQTLPSRTLNDFRGDPIPLPASEGWTHLQLRRYAGCPICNMHLHALAKRAEEVKAAGIHEIVVFYSTKVELAKHQHALPFAAIADPERLLYVEFGAESSRTASLSPGSVIQGMRGMFTGRGALPKGLDDIAGKPAEFLIDPNGTVVAAKYGGHADDQWSVDELLETVRQLESRSSKDAAEAVASTK